MNVRGVLLLSLLAGCNLLLDNQEGIVDVSDGGEGIARVDGAASSSSGSSDGSDSGSPPDALAEGGPDGPSGPCVDRPWSRRGTHVVLRDAPGAHAWLLNGELTLFSSTALGEATRSTRQDRLSPFTGPQEESWFGFRPVVDSLESLAFTSDSEGKIHMYRKEQGAWIENNILSTQLPTGTLVVGSLRQVGTQQELWVHRVQRDGTSAGWLSFETSMMPNFLSLKTASVTDSNQNDYGASFPVISADGSRLYFTHEAARANSPAPSRGALMVARRSTNEAVFDSPQVILDLGEEGVTSPHPNWISPDECRLYYSDQVGETWQLFVLERQ